MSDPGSPMLTLEVLKGLVDGGAVAIRGRATLDPAGGQGDKVFPPSHSVGDRATTKYAFERRRMNGVDVECVLLDSVQSQANRMEEALQSLWAARRIALPVIAADFSDAAPDVGVVTSLGAPHRIADALLRDSLLDGVFFRESAIGKSFSDATARNASPLFTVCPHRPDLWPVGQYWSAGRDGVKVRPRDRFGNRWHRRRGRGKDSQPH